jgi:hypothetical protein
MLQHNAKHNTKGANTMTNVQVKAADVKTGDRIVAREGIDSVLERRGQELILYRLRCARTANGLSHYYMYGDVAPEETLL